MIVFDGPRGQIIAAALDLAKDEGWSKLSLLQIAQKAELSLVELRTHFSSKGAILTAFMRLVDDAVIAKPPRAEDDESARDRLFEVIMNRFDVLAPYKPALKSIAADPVPTPSQIRALACSQHWMMQAAGLSTDGLRGDIRIAGLMGVYVSVFRSWLSDDDEGLARTMAKLDRRLRRGESSLQQLDELACGAKKSAKRLASVACCVLPRRWRSGKSGDGSSGEAGGGASGSDTDTGTGTDTAQTAPPDEPANGAAPAPAA